ncbi:MAG: hypothetical protein JF606_25460 [Burkholderiales bacterium]|nr:hypothetical protein [Burkholderiales bacterium]
MSLKPRAGPPEGQPAPVHVARRDRGTHRGRDRYNASPHDGLNGRTPLEAVEHSLRGRGTVVTWLPEAKRRTLCLMQTPKRATVRGYLHQGQRPHINFHGVRYTNTLLASTTAFLGQSLRIYYHSDDLRTVRTFAPDGAEIGRAERRGTARHLVVLGAAGMPAAPQEADLDGLLAALERAARPPGPQVRGPRRRRVRGHGRHASLELDGGEPELEVAPLLFPAPPKRSDSGRFRPPHENPAVARPTDNFARTGNPQPCMDAPGLSNALIVVCIATHS